MKKVFSILLVFSMLFMLFSGVTVFAADLIAGNEVIDRATGPDSWTDFYLADRNNGFAEDYIMTGFSAYVARLSPFKFMVFAENEDVWEVVWESDEIIPTELGVYNGVIDPGVLIPAGCYVGLYYPENGAVLYSVTDVAFEENVLTRAVLFTDNENGEEFVDFYNSGDRIYSIQATGIMVPETEWLTPLANDNFRLNVKATLPVKFRLDGEFDDVKLMINDVEVEIDYKECEEDCDDFYMSLFKPTESGDYTATVLVNGTPVLTKDFVVFENMPNGNIKVQAKVKAEIKADEKTEVKAEVEAKIKGKK